MNDMWWLLFIILHAVSGVTCFMSGLLLLSPKRSRQDRKLLSVFLASLTGLIVFLVAALLVHWPTLTLIPRIIYIGLFGLSLYMMYRALKARQKLLGRTLSFDYVDDIGFPLIALFNGFIIVALIDLRAPIWLVIIGAVVAAIVGGQLVERRKNSLLHK